MRAWPESSRGRLGLEPASLTTRLIWSTPEKKTQKQKKGEARPKATKIEDQMKQKWHINPGLIKILVGARGEMAKRFKKPHLNPTPLFLGTARTPKAHAVWGTTTNNNRN